MAFPVHTSPAGLARLPDRDRGFDRHCWSLSCLSGVGLVGCVCGQALYGCMQTGEAGHLPLSPGALHRDLWLGYIIGLKYWVNQYIELLPGLFTETCGSLWLIEVRLGYNIGVHLGYI